jgi:hypothetical protein
MFHVAECKALAEQALMKESGVQVLRIIAEAFIEKNLNLLVPPNLRESLEVGIA